MDFHLVLATDLKLEFLQNPQCTTDASHMKLLYLLLLKNLVKLCGSGSQLILQLDCEKGKACIKFSCQLGAPANLHFVPHIQQDALHGFHGQHLPHHRRHKGPSQQKRDRACAAAHRARQNAASASSISTETSRSTPAPSDASASAGTSSPPRVGPSAPPAASAYRTATQHPTAVAAEQHAHAVHDEICSDTMYNKEEVGNYG